MANAMTSFKKRMVLVIFTPFGDTTRPIATSTAGTAIPVPDISFAKNGPDRLFCGVQVLEETLTTDTQYGTEHVFYVER